MKKIIFMLLFSTINNFVHAQSIELLDTNAFAEIEIKPKFLLFQESTIKNTCIGIDKIEEKNIEVIFADKSIYQLMYWRYAGIGLNEKTEKESIKNISKSITEEDFINIGSKLFRFGVLKTIIDE